MICDRCHLRIDRSDNPDQPLCNGCLRHLRAGGAWTLGSPTQAGAKRLACPLDLLPFRALLLYGEVPLYPIGETFDLAVSDVACAADDPAAHWRVEAVRWRRGAGYGKPLEQGLPIIAGRTAARLWKLAERRLADRSAV